jgi:hypothetical protein
VVTNPGFERISRQNDAEGETQEVPDFIGSLGWRTGQDKIA